MKWLVNLLGGGLLGGVRDIVSTVAGDQAARDQQTATDMSDVRQQFAAEFAAPERQGWWNSLVDGLNRLVRPAFTFGLAGLFVWCVVDPIEFAEAMTALQLVPEMMWWIALTIIAFWFGGRMLEGVSPKGMKFDARQAAAVVGQMKELGALKPQEPERAAIMAAEYESELRAREPMSNAAILEWNRRRQEGWRAG
jgi:hypothetical protein